jgi:Xaa-Pro aminopeptidase
MARDDSLHFQKDFDAEELSDRRKRVMSKMGSGIAVVAAATEVPGFDPFRQKNDFHYLTGVKVPQAYLILDA